MVFEKMKQKKIKIKQSMSFLDVLVSKKMKKFP